MRAYAEGLRKGQTAGSGTKAGQSALAANMKKAGKTTRQINAALKRAAKLPNAQTMKL